jgi:hypothetical protein
MGLKVRPVANTCGIKVNQSQACGFRGNTHAPWSSIPIEMCTAPAFASIMRGDAQTPRSDVPGDTKV